MEAKEKRKLKKRYKTYTWLGYACVIFFVLYLTTIFIVRSKSDANWDKPSILIPIMIGILLPLALGFIFTMFASLKRTELLHYKKRIEIYRARMFAMRVIEHLQEGEVQQAVDEYLKSNEYPEKSLDDYVYGMLIMSCHLSKDESLHKKGLFRINHIKDKYDPSRVKL